MIRVQSLVLSGMDLFNHWSNICTRTFRYSLTLSYTYVCKLIASGFQSRRINWQLFFSPYPVTSDAMQWATCPLQANRKSGSYNSLVSTYWRKLAVDIWVRQKNAHNVNQLIHRTENTKFSTRHSLKATGGIRIMLYINTAQLLPTIVLFFRPSMCSYTARPGFPNYFARGPPLASKNNHWS